ncbi:uncharacterized protein LOC116027653 [Ipomoea triloba]|uniref:uncharacterized protein LOC116027653 n=1 Tax=Ipomoea triloba TaxID=35885 RepID=UPI00125D8F8D|nr:uncharacterized protein LOC116027653 [Ipomoea triloba]
MNPQSYGSITFRPVAIEYEDSWFWLGDPRGIYTVKDDYKRIIGEFVHTPGTFDKWLHLWKIKCPAKWKVFVWRALSNVLPTTTNLILKRVEIDPACPMCGILHENTMHSLLLCDFSSLVWHESSLHVPSVGGDDFGECGGRGIWHYGKAHFRSPSPYADRLVLRSRRGVRCTQQQNGQPSAQAVTNHPVHNAELLCYVDAGFHQQTKEATVGAVLMPHGSFVAAFNSRLPNCYSPLMAESLACKKALSWLKGRGYPRCISTRIVPLSRAC